MGMIILGERLSFGGFFTFVELHKGGSVRVGLPRLVYSSSWKCLAGASKIDRAPAGKKTH